MTTIRDFLDKRRDQKQSGEPSPDAKPKGKPAKAEVDPKAVITFACGHKIGANHFRQRKCGECVRQDQMERRKRKQQQQQAKGAEKKAGNDAGRLPEGSTFSVMYNAGKKEWAGTLATTVAGNARVFQDCASGVFTLLGQLDARYRKAVAGVETPDAEALRPESA